MPQENAIGKFLSKLEKLRQRTSRFRRVALHVHSPDSWDWNCRGDKAANEKSQFLKDGGEQEFLRHLRTHFDLVAITDHMKSGYAARLSNSCRGEKDFAVLPGMEVNFLPEAALSVARLHLLTIMPEGTSVEAVSRTFAKIDGIPDDDKRTGQEEVKGCALKEWIQRIKHENGICIAAHVNASQGIRRHFRQTGKSVIKLMTDDPDEQNAQERDLSDELKEYLLDAGFAAIEVTHGADQRHYRWESQSKGRQSAIPVTLQLDAHCVEDLNRPERTTHIKMTNVGFKGLCSALNFPETRVRFPNDLPVSPSPQLLGLELVGNEASLFGHETIAFAENLNCIIGPRGAGKSTIVEAIRYLFGYNRTLGELDVANRLSDRIRGMQQANLSGCLIRAAYRTIAGDTRILESTFDSREDYATKVYTASGEPVDIVDIEATGDYPLRLFGWSEIETLGRDKGRQRDLLDRLVPELSHAKSERSEIRSKLRENRESVSVIIASLSSILDKEGGIIRRYSEYKSEFEKINTPEVKTQFEELDSANLKLAVFQLMRKNVDNLRSKAKDLDIQALRDGIAELLEDAPDAIQQWWPTDASKALALVDAEAEITKHVSAILRVLDNTEALVRNQIDETKKEVEAIEQTIRSSFADDSDMRKIADLRANAERRLRQAGAVRSEYSKEWERLFGALKARKSLTDQLAKLHDEIAGIRVRNNEKIEATLNEQFSDGVKVSLSFRPGGDRSAFIEALGQNRVAQAFSSRYKVRRIPEILAEVFNPITLVQKLVHQEEAAFAGARLTDDGAVPISPEEAKKGVSDWKCWDNDEGASVKALTSNGETLKRLLRLQEVEWDDEESILLDGRPVGELSPGQRSSAMLPLIALAEPTPLVIDQPEDNLDNRLIGQVLAGILATLKERRQIIVCTHNPNIVVSGDAEQVVVLNALSDCEATVEKHGSIDNDDIVQSVIDIMEGGREAFRVRQRRYGMELPASLSS